MALGYALQYDSLHYTMLLLDSYSSHGNRLLLG